MDGTHCKFKFAKVALFAVSCPTEHNTNQVGVLFELDAELDSVPFVLDEAQIVLPALRRLVEPIVYTNGSSLIRVDTLLL